MKKNHYQKRYPIKDYFPLPNEIFYLNLSYGEIAVYSYLLHCENRKSFQCYPSYKTIGEALQMSRTTVSKYIVSPQQHPPKNRLPTQTQAK